MSIESLERDAANALLDGQEFGSGAGSKHSTGFLKRMREAPTPRIAQDFTAELADTVSVSTVAVPLAHPRSSLPRPSGRSEERNGTSASSEKFACRFGRRAPENRPRFAGHLHGSVTAERVDSQTSGHHHPGPIAAPYARSS
jgi:hypothetical protein